MATWIFPVEGLYMPTLLNAGVVRWSALTKEPLKRKQKEISTTLPSVILRVIVWFHSLFFPSAMRPEFAKQALLFPCWSTRWYEISRSLSEKQIFLFLVTKNFGSFLMEHNLAQADWYKWYKQTPLRNTGFVDIVNLIWELLKQAGS